MESTRRRLLPNPWYKKHLDMDDMYEPLKCDRSDALGDRLEKAWLEQKAKSKEPSLVMAVCKAFWKEFMLLGLLDGVTVLILRPGQALLLGKLLHYFREGSNLDYHDGLIYASGLVATSAIYAVCLNQFVITGWHTGMKVRVAICSLIYRKALKLSQTAVGGTGAGRAVNLLSNDVSRFEWLSLFVNSLWTAPLVTIIVSALIWYEIGWAGVIGIFAILIVVLIQSYASKLSPIFRLKTVLRTDERVRFMDEIIAGVQVIKMYAWEAPFAKLIAFTRTMEMKYVKLNNYVRGIYMTFVIFTPRAAVCCTMLAITLLHGSNQITTANVFAISAYFMIVSQMLADKFVCGVAEVSESLVAFRRLQHFLQLDEKEQQSIGGYTDDNVNDKNASVFLQNVTARWMLPEILSSAQDDANPLTESYTKDRETAWKSATLNSLYVDFHEGELIGIIGPIGAGKSSLLQAILRELPIVSGAIHVNGAVSYASQEPWLFVGTVRQNIVFGQAYDRNRYNAVVRACALATDFEQLPDGDQTVVGERGISLSGGQKARVNLARAVYRQSDVYLLDDPLSAVDIHVGTHIFSKCIGPKGYLAQLNATRILVTHQVHLLKEADWVIVLQEGAIIAQGAPSDLAENGIDLVTLVENDAENPDRPRQSVYEPTRSMSVISSGRSSSICSAFRGSICNVEYGIELNEEFIDSSSAELTEAHGTGEARRCIIIKYFRAGANWPFLCLLLLMFALTQFLASAADIWLSIWAKNEEQRSLNRSMALSMANSTESDPEHETHLNFLTSIELTPMNCMYVHAALVAALFVIALVRSIAFQSMCARASQTLHDGMFKGLISTTMHFFDTNPSGRALNRCAKDIGTMDELLPKTILDAAQYILNMTGAVIVTAIVNPIFLMPVFLMSFIFVFMRRAFLKTSKSIKRLEGNAKSPVFTHLAATLNGLSTIRAYNAQEILTQEFDHHQDAHTSCWYMLIMANLAFGLSLDMMCFLLIFSIISYYMIFDNTASGDQIGLAITQALTLTGILQWSTRQSAEISNQMMAVERILEYCDLEPEAQPDQSCALDEDWPAAGCVEFNNVVYRYAKDAEPVLRHLSFVIQPREKIGIVGRTGAGKSSLIGALFRLACIEGKITVDGIDTSSVSLERLRSSIAIIPQDPVLFSGTLRRNLDPFEEYDDPDIWNALEKVELREIASGQLGLNSPVMAHGSNFSVGQRQLICLARAILRQNRILVLDEATANVDPKTDLMIQDTIREKFAECTVLTIAHRLHTIIDSDRILVMDAGQAVEFDDAYTLLEKKSGIFNGMVTALGKQEQKRLLRAALGKYNAKYEVPYQQSYHSYL